MIKSIRIKYLVFIIANFLLVNCTEIYEPKINASIEALVVEGLITDGDGPFVIKLSMVKRLSVDTFGVKTLIVHGAKMTITDNEKNSYSFTESSGGNYVLPSNFKAKIGNTYKLQIKTKDGSIYESNFEKLEIPQSYDSIKAIYTSQDLLDKNNQIQNVTGSDIRVDLFNSISNGSEKPKCRFDSKVTVQYWYIYRDRDINGNEIMSYHWANFGWKTYNVNSNNNITTEDLKTAELQIENHSLGFVPFEASSYLLDIPNPVIIQYLRVDQYTLNSTSYRFYQSANKQLSSDGKIFDPISSQVYGNMRCINYPSKIVLGLFEVSSVRKHAFLIERPTSKTVSIRSTRVMEIPIMVANEFLYGDFQYMVWDGPDSQTPNSPAYTLIPLPLWWHHN